jgi:hypothetical protein
MHAGDIRCTRTEGRGRHRGSGEGLRRRNGRGGRLGEVAAAAKRGEPHDRIALYPRFHAASARLRSGRLQRETYLHRGSRGTADRFDGVPRVRIGKNPKPGFVPAGRGRETTKRSARIHYWRPERILRHGVRGEGLRCQGRGKRSGEMPAAATRVSVRVPREGNPEPGFVPVSRGRETTKRLTACRDREVAKRSTQFQL